MEAFKWRNEIVQDTSSADMRVGVIVMVAASSVGATDDCYTKRPLLPYLLPVGERLAETF